MDCEDSTQLFMSLGWVYCTVTNKRNCLALSKHDTGILFFLTAICKFYTNYLIMQGSMVPVLQCLENLKAHFAYNAARENIQSCSRKRWDQPDRTSLAETDSCLKDASKFQHVDDSAESGIMIH